MNRRTFLSSAAAAAVPIRPISGVVPRTRPVLCIFSKHMAQFDWDTLGAKSKELGFEGVDLTARPKGHVLPERVEQDLPRAVEAIRKHKVDVPMVTTDLKSAADPAARPTFAAMQKLGIQLYKPGYWRYAKDKSTVQSVGAARQDFLSLLQLGREFGVTAGIHNHSGDYVGAAVWDTREILAGSDAKDAGYYFDPGHATIEGGLHGWRASLDLASERLKMVAMKDFYWEKTDKGWRTKWVPLGEGMVNWQAVFAQFAKSKFTGPITLHVEYQTPDELAAIAKDLAFMKKVTSEAYGS